ncbi:MAG: single-stranded DNA-binding protein [Actinomycetota bacterium]|jgi:single-strand DNA-binding protein|nr:single-stranded DNA-binding protein [Actinomycetota bacterium]
MNYVNNIYLLGNLTRNPEIKYTNEGIAITEMGLAVNKKWTDKNGKESEMVDFFNVTTWGNLAENCAAALKKGDRVLLSGHLNLRSWENKEGKKYNIINITADVIAASLEFDHVSIPEKDNPDKSKKKNLKKEKIEIT